MAKENRNPQDAKTSPHHQPEENRTPSPGQATSGVGNVAGQKAASQTGSKGTLDQGGKLGDAGSGAARASRHEEDE